MKYAITFDIGTTGVKTCVFEISDTIKLLGSASKGYQLYVFPDGGAEQDPDEWWAALCETSKAAIEKSGIPAEKIEGISFCSQMQGLVLVDNEGNAVRRAMSYMDQRARQELKEGMGHGVQVMGANVVTLLKSLKITGAAALSVKDPVWKYNWVKKHEPDVFSKVYKWLDVKEYLICRMTGECCMTSDSAFGALLYDLSKKDWSVSLAKDLGVNPDHLPKIIKSTDIVGKLREKQAEELGLAAGTAVFGGGGDASLIGVGAGAVDVGDTHAYMGTSGWVSTVTDKSVVDATHMIAAVVGADPGKFNYFGELETAGKCLEWVKDHLALDEINIYKQKVDVAESYETEYTSLYDYMTEIISQVPAGSNGVIFTPWLHGNRCPFEDPNAKGIFFNLSLESGKSDMIRAVVEGVCYHLRWFMETEANNKKVSISDTIRFVGGGALSYMTCQILADVLGKKVETVDSPQNVGAVGAAVTIAVGLGMISSFSEAKKLIPATKTYNPTQANKAVYDKQFAVFKELYKSNKKNFAGLNG